MFMLKCLITLKDITIQKVFCNPNSNVPMPFATVESAHKFAEQNLLNKKFENIVNKNSVVAFQVTPFQSK